MIYGETITEILLKILPYKTLLYKEVKKNSENIKNRDRKKF